MAELKSQKNRASVQNFIKGIADDQMRKDCRVVMKMMSRATGKRPSMWGTGIVGYGSYHYRYASGREGDWFQTGFSPRKQNLSLYIMPGFDKFATLLKKLGNHKTGKSCLYIKRLEDVDLGVLEELIGRSVRLTERRKQG